MSETLAMPLSRLVVILAISCIVLLCILAGFVSYAYVKSTASQQTVKHWKHYGETLQDLLDESNRQVSTALELSKEVRESNNEQTTYLENQIKSRNIQYEQHLDKLQNYNPTLDESRRSIQWQLSN